MAEDAQVRHQVWSFFSMRREPEWLFICIRCFNSRKKGPFSCKKRTVGSVLLEASSCSRFSDLWPPRSLLSGFKIIRIVYLLRWWAKNFVLRSSIFRPHMSVFGRNLVIWDKNMNFFVPWCEGLKIGIHSNWGSLKSFPALFWWKYFKIDHYWFWKFSRISRPCDLCN